MAYERDQVKELIDGTIDFDTLHRMLSSPKDAERFGMMLEILQEQVPWKDRILLPLGPNLFIVQRALDKRWVTKCRCGHEFSPWKENWKLNALIHVRETPESLNELYPRLMSPDPGWQVFREYFCPGCASLLEVEAPTPWYPVIHDFEPDIVGFYRDWLGLEVPQGSET